MPELPDITIYIEALSRHVLKQPLEKVRITSPFLLRSFNPPISAAQGKRVVGFKRLGKRIVFCLEDDLFLVLHLMIAGRLRWRPRGIPVPAKVGLAAFDFPNGTLLLTEASTQKRASLFLVRGEESLKEHQPGGLEILEATEPEFQQRIRLENRTLKRALTDPRLFSGIGKAYSDEILHRARLSPVTLTSRLSDSEIARLFDATVAIMNLFVARIRDEIKQGFPEEVTAFRPDMAVHGRFGKPCPACGTAVQRIVYAENEANYCPACQTGGKLLADRSLSRLLKDDWPRTLEELEEKKAALRQTAAPPLTAARRSRKAAR